MSKRVYISADYDETDGDREVVEELTKWGGDDKHKVDFVDMAQVASGSVSEDEDCRICDLKAEFNSQIDASSAVIFIVGNKTASRTAGSGCERASKSQDQCSCTPYKSNRNGIQPCKVSITYDTTPSGDYGCINSCSYLKHEFKQAEKKNKDIIIVYNSTRKESAWLPSYMSDFESEAVPFWKINDSGNRIGNYEYIKQALGFE